MRLDLLTSTWRGYTSADRGKARRQIRSSSRGDAKTSQEPTQPSDDEVAEEVLAPATPGAEALGTDAPEESDEASGP